MISTMHVETQKNERAKCSITCTVLRKCHFWVIFRDFLFVAQKMKMNGCTYDFPALRVRRTETRLTVYWASQYQNHSKPPSKEPATFGEKHHFKVNNFENKCTRCTYVYELLLECKKLYP